MSPNKISIAFVCIGNACRSQMSEGLARHLGGAKVEVYSAGSVPAGFVAEEAVEALAENDIDISSHYSKGVDELPERIWDYVITMGCGDSCPTLRAKQRLDWEIPDPVGLPLKEFRKVRDDLERRIKDLMAQWEE